MHLTARLPTLMRREASSLLGSSVQSLAAAMNMGSETSMRASARVFTGSSPSRSP